MARKYDLITELYSRTVNAVASPQNWEAFLRSACRNFKLRFDEQLLVFAQRPDATAVLEINKENGAGWNNTFGRWVNRGAKGIAVFEDADRSRQRLIHYFDISDTHPSRFAKPVPIWQMQPEYEQEVIETLENTFGSLEDKETLASAIMSAAANAVEDNLPDYVCDLLYAAESSFLEELSEDMITAMYRKTVRNSVAFMMISRLDMDTSLYFEREDFEDVVNFNTPDTLNALGFATSDIAEMGLSEIGKTVLALNRRNRIIAESSRAYYNANIERNYNTERSMKNERTDLHDAGRLQSARPEIAGAAGGTAGPLRSDAEKISKRTPQSPVLQSSDELQTQRTPVGDRAESDQDGGNADTGNGGKRGADRTDESSGYDDLGSQNEQHQEQSAGDRESGSNLRLDYYDRAHEDKSLPFFGDDDTIRAILATTPHLKASKEEILAFYENTLDDDARTEYIKSIFNNDYTEIVLDDGRRVGYKTFQNVLHLWEGSYLSRTKQSYYAWGVIAKHFEAMRLLGELYDEVKPLPSVDGQTSFINDREAEEKPSAFSLSQEIIDAVLARGSGMAEGKFRIYEQFQKSLSKKENVDFLKDEYGWGGVSSVIIGTGLSEQHDSKGISISKGIGNNTQVFNLNWNQVEKRITELIKLDRYLNPKEKAQYPEWLNRQEQRRAEFAEQRRSQEILPTSPTKQEAVQQEPSQYAYHLGDKVYIGADEFEILSFDDERVMLYDTSFPLLNKEMTRTEFDAKVRENPMNDHLKAEADKVPAFDIGMGYLGNGLTVWNKAVEVNGDYLTLAHIGPDGKVRYYVDGLPEEVKERIEQAAAQEQQKTLFAASYHVGDRVSLDGKPFEITRVDDWNVELMDRSAQNPQPRLERKDSFMQLVAQNEHDNRLMDTHPAYSEIKNENPDSLVLYQVGDFFEAYGMDAQTVSEALGLNLTSRAIGNNQRTEMCGFPVNRLETYVNMLLDRGFDVAVSALENGEHSTRNIVSSNKENLVQSVPVGRIEYLHTDGRVRESIEYTSPYQMEKDVKEENFYGVPMRIVFYADADGKAVEHGYVSQLDPPPQGFAVITSPYLDVEPVPPLDRAKRYIHDFCQMEYGSEVDFSNLREIGIAHTTVTDKELPIQVNVNLIDPSIERFLDGKPLDSRRFDNLEQLIENELKDLEFHDLISVTDEQVQQILKTPVTVTPAWEQPKKRRMQSFDPHPEIPLSDRRSFNLKEHEIEEVGKKERFHRNYAAIQVLKNCQSENRFATPDEQIILSKYVGWGGIPEVFDENTGSWQNEYIMLKNILTPEEYASARESTLTAFYTPPTVIKAIYKALEQMGFQEGNILEPSCGIGHFIGMLPDSLKEAKVYGVELDTISAGIAQQLYQKSSIAAQGFEETNLPDSFFDAVVGNVPFGDFKVIDKRYDKYKFLIHDYFLAKSLDKLRPNGVMAIVTSKGTMDKENPAVRKYIAQRADLLGAIRLPNNTFRGNAGTEVVSDILILQKRDRIVDIEPSWVHLSTDENGVAMNSYFVEHPEMVLGEMKMVSGRFGMESTCVPYENADLTAQLDEAITNIHGEISDYEMDEELDEEDNSIPADPMVRNFSYTLYEDKIYFRENSRMTPVEASATAENRIKGMISIRDSVRRLIELQTEDYPDSEIKTEQERLNKLYDTFTAKYGLINSRANISAFSQDSSFSLLSALEIIGDDGELERKADMFFKRTIKPHIPVTSVDTASEALAVSMGEKACVDMEYMMELSGKTEEEIYQELKGVIFLNPMHGYGGSTEVKYLMADEYLSGNVREKLEWAKRSAEMYPDDYAINVEALKRVQPKDLDASEIAVRLGATWLPPEIVEQFMFEFLDTPRYAQWNIKVHYSPHTGEWNVEGKSYDRANLKAYSTYGTNRINAYKIIEETLNLRDVRIFDYVEDADGKRKPVLNKNETAIAQSKQELIKQGFLDWIWAEPDRRERLTKLYNEKFNSIRPREYDGSHIVFNGMNPEIELREHQKNAVARILYGGNSLLAHAVGAGKTYTMAAAAMELKRLGLCSKSLFVVPNHLTEQWAAEFLQLYPAANVLVATKKDFETKNRKRFCGRIATGDYDAVIIGHSQFEKIPMSLERQRALLEQQLDTIAEGIAELKRNRDDSFSVKQLERTKKSVKQKLDKLNDQTKKDDVVTFEELGVDRLFVDESHYYKNLFLFTKMRNVGGIAQTEAQKSSDLFMKCRYLDELTGGRGTVFATGTPISNSMVELYTIQRYLQYGTLLKNKLQHFDSWASTFGETITAVELSPEGTGYRAKTRFAKFYNLPELMAMFKEVADIQTSDMLNLPVPKANFHNISVKPSEMQKEMVAELAKRAEKVRNGMVDSREDNMLKITNDGRKLALDQRLINPMLPDFEGSKLNACVDAMFSTWEKGKEQKLTQLFFCDLSTPKNDGSFNVYDDIRKKLVERGVPESEVRFIHEADTEAKKLELFKKVRKGEVRILMGSTQKMGAGTNVQNKLAASYDLDCPWRPSDLEQRLGRSIRQGNENSEVDIFRFVTEDTFDAYLYQLVEGKQKFASQIMTSKSPVRSCEDIDETALSYAEIKMLATGNPHIKEKMDLDVQVQKLRLLKSNYLSEKYRLEDKILKYYPHEITRQTETIQGLKSDISRVAQHPKPLDDTFVGMQVLGVFFSEKAEAGKAILSACQSMTSPDPVPLGEYRGFPMELFFDSVSREYKVKLKGELSYTIALGTDTFGNITRLDNGLESLSKRLETAEQELANTKKQLETAKIDVEKPFPQEEELKTKTIRLDELNILLNMDKRENEIVGGELDESEDAEMAPQKKAVGYER